MTAENQVFDTLSQFRIVYVGATLFLLVISVVQKRWKLVTIGMVLLIGNSCPVAALYIPNGAESVTNTGQVFRIVLINPKADKNHETVKAVEYARSVSPDVVVFTELTSEWETVLRQSFKDYPHKIVAFRTNGLAVFSKLPLKNAIISYLPGVPVDHPHVVCDLDVGSQKVRLVVVHLCPPSRSFRLRNAEMKTIAIEAHLSRLPVLVIGDLNCGPWSRYFRDLLEDGCLIDSEQGFGPQSTWNAEIVPVVPIDHILTTKHFVTRNRTTGPSIGSDHLPVCADLLLRR